MNCQLAGAVRRALQASLLILGTAHLAGAQLQRLAIRPFKAFSIGGSSGKGSVNLPAFCLDQFRDAPPRVSNGGESGGASYGSVPYSDARVVVTPKGSQSALPPMRMADAVRRGYLKLGGFSGRQGFGVQFGLGPNAKAVRVGESSEGSVLGFPGDSHVPKLPKDVWRGGVSREEAQILFWDARARQELGDQLARLANLPSSPLGLTTHPAGQANLFTSLWWSDHASRPYSTIRRAMNQAVQIAQEPKAFESRAGASVLALRLVQDPKTNTLRLVAKNGLSYGTANPSDGAQMTALRDRLNRLSERMGDDRQIVILTDDNAPDAIAVSLAGGDGDGGKGGGPRVTVAGGDDGGDDLFFSGSFRSGKYRPTQIVFFGKRRFHSEARILDDGTRSYRLNVLDTERRNVKEFWRIYDSSAVVATPVVKDKIRKTIKTMRTRGRDLRNMVVLLGKVKNALNLHPDELASSDPGPSRESLR